MGAMSASCVILLLWDKQIVEKIDEEMRTFSIYCKFREEHLFNLIQCLLHGRSQIISQLSWTVEVLGGDKVVSNLKMWLKVDGFVNKVKQCWGAINFKALLGLA